MSDLFLVIEASTYTGSAALLTGSGNVIAHTQTPMRGEEEERLLPAIAEMMRGAGVVPEDLAGIVCGAGPGSFTSLRIAAAIAKGFAIGLQVPMFSVSSLLLIAAAANPPLSPGSYLAMLDAMRGESYGLLCHVNDAGTITADGEWSLMPGDPRRTAALSSTLATDIGPGRSIDTRPHARGAASLIERIVNAGEVDAAAWEPDYGRLAEAEVRLNQMNAAAKPA